MNCKFYQFKNFVDRNDMSIEKKVGGIHYKNILSCWSYTL